MITVLACWASLTCAIVGFVEADTIGREWEVVGWATAAMAFLFVGVSYAS